MNAILKTTSKFLPLISLLIFSACSSNSNPPAANAPTATNTAAKGGEQELM